MKILVTSDLHGYLPHIEDKFDLLLICGDICPHTNHTRSYQREWLQTTFVDWANNLPFNDEFSKVIFVAGNHDLQLEQFNEFSSFVKSLETSCHFRLKYIKNSVYEHEYLSNEGLKTLKIFGTPYCKIFGNWAFMKDEEILKEKYAECPNDVDIFISHDSPTINNLGLINNGYYKGTDAGNKILDETIERVKPKYFFSGHIHSGNHSFEEINGVKMANVSYVNEHYEPFYPILDFNI